MHLLLQLGHPRVCPLPLLSPLQRREGTWPAGSDASLANIWVYFVGQASDLLRPTMRTRPVRGQFGWSVGRHVVNSVACKEDADVMTLLRVTMHHLCASSKISLLVGDKERR
jgi:hypothetical protein